MPPSTSECKCGESATGAAAGSVAACPACPPTAASACSLGAACAIADADPAHPLPFTIRPATAADATLLHRLVAELAAYESLSHELESTPAAHAEHLFGPRPRAAALLAFVRGFVPVGFAVWYPTYSTFAGRPGAFLEDLYVRPGFRRHGIGRALLEASAAAALADGCSRLEWRALKWNTPALDFYKSTGAEPLSEWVTLRRELTASRQ
ncbi:MAG: GNAT family N-acetyltransferase [Puniceicoccales bacterium]|nr:GNAT family N-acetyltransferase [Puniceicoccales bacterium]